jgi:septal ring factor EnvC (AmiA/AmiB activator)
MDFLKDFKEISSYIVGIGGLLASILIAYYKLDRKADRDWIASRDKAFQDILENIKKENDRRDVTIAELNKKEEDINKKIAELQEENGRFDERIKNANQRLEDCKDNHKN